MKTMRNADFTLIICYVAIIVLALNGKCLCTIYNLKYSKMMTMKTRFFLIIWEFALIWDSLGKKQQESKKFCIDAPLGKKLTNNNEDFFSFIL